jgi:putative flippase GtrA
MICRKAIDTYKKHMELSNYLIFGVLTTVVNWIVFQLFNELLSVTWAISNVIAWIASILFAYFTNRKYVFPSSGKHIAREFALFVQFRLVSLLLEMLFLFILIELALLEPFTSKVITAVIVVGSNYVFSKLIVFRKRRNINGSD